MSAYIVLPLTWLRLSKSRLDFFQRGIHFAAREAGLGLQKTKPGHYCHRVVDYIEEHLSHDEQLTSLEPNDISEGEPDDISEGWELQGIPKVDFPSLAGWHLLGRIPNEKYGLTTKRIHHEIESLCPRDNDGKCRAHPRLKIPLRFFLAAKDTVLWEENLLPSEPGDTFDWREFRVLLAILSLGNAARAKNKPCMPSAMTIALQASGILSKKVQQRGVTLPEHCPILSRDQVERTLRKLDGRFYTRRKVSKATDGRGGKFIYEFRCRR